MIPGTFLSCHIVLLPLHEFGLELMKNSAKDLNRNGICNRSLNVSPVTCSKRIFVRSHIHELMNDRYFDEVVPRSEETA